MGLRLVTVINHPQSHKNQHQETTYKPEKENTKTQWSLGEKPVHWDLTMPLI